MSCCGILYCDIFQGGLRPSPESFNKYLPFFLVDNPSQSCPKGGHAAYGNAVQMIPANGSDDTNDVSTGLINIPRVLFWVVVTICSFCAALSLIKVAIFF